MTHVSRETFLDRVRRATPERGDILYSREGSYHGIAAEVPEGYEVCMGQRMVLIRPDQNALNFRFLRYWLNSVFVKSFIAGMREGSGAPRINLPAIRGLLIPVPVLSEQNSIARILGALDDKIAVNERIAAAALELADTLFNQAAFSLAFGEETFGSVATVAGGGTPSTKVDEYWGGKLSWTTPSDVTALPSPYLFETSRSITELGLENCASQLYPALSIFMTSRATIGAFALPQVPAAVNQGFIVVLPPNEEMRWWLLHEMRSRVDEMMSLANGSTFLELSRKNFKTMQIRLPDATGVATFARTAAPLHSAAALAARENKALAALRDTLLPQLMSGRLRVKDAEKIVEDHA
ncbi:MULTISPECIES: restriction endonuclease subunit S [unclassified Streptomyces]|uniref:restriction endonuclease subunit S n=1 Tax=unclassified Streptomyces TaxID=2593676 RepID=UPI003424B440